MNDALEMQGSDCGRGGHSIEGQEAGPATSGREGGTDRCGKKVGRRQRDKGQRDTDSERWTERKWKDRHTQTQGEMRTETEMRVGEAEIHRDRNKVGQRQCDRKREKCRDKVGK